jgi:GTP-binding protein Era
MGGERDQRPFRSGFVAIVGAPNVGKSTLLNRVLGQKISITSRKPQTTRNRILGILHRDRSQMVFIDTPGIHRSAKPLNERIVEAAVAVLAEVDLVLVLVDLTRSDPDAETMIAGRLAGTRTPLVLALNKTDLVEPARVLEAIDAWSPVLPFAAVVPVSAAHGEGLLSLIEAMEGALPQGPPLYPEDMVTDVSERFLAGEIVREKVFRLTGQEIPYATAVTVESFREENAGGLVRIGAVIHVERDSQKGIVIGRKGAKLKEIGRDARIELERMLGKRVYLELFVRVQKNWTKDAKALKRFGY